MDVFSKLISAVKSTVSVKQSNTDYISDVSLDCATVVRAQDLLKNHTYKKDRGHMSTTNVVRTKQARMTVGFSLRVALS